jgi:3-keto-5-aminohexanoate cleavage enzyme
MKEPGMIEPLGLAEARRQENAAPHQFVSGFELQDAWKIPSKIAINVAVSPRAAIDQGTTTTRGSLEQYIEAASEVIDAGACGVHLDFGYVVDSAGRALTDLPPVDAYTTVLEPLRARFGDRFVANLNVLNGKTFDECLSPAVAGLAEVAPCAAGHPDAFMIPAVQTCERYGVKPEIVVHDSGEIDLARRKLIETKILQKPYNWIVLFGLPFSRGRTLLSGTWVRDTQDLAQQLFLMVNQIRSLDHDSIITVCAAGRATLYLTTLATMLGIHIRVGTEDTGWKYPHRPERFANNLEIFEAARDIAIRLGREPATAAEYRAMLGMRTKEQPLTA